MDKPQHLELTLSAEGIDNYCRGLVRHVPSVERRVVALDALQTFVAAMSGPAGQVQPVYAAIRETLARHLDGARAELHAAQAKALVEALSLRSLPRITPIYTAVSRDAFWQLLGTAAERLGAEACRELAAWSDGWLAELTARSAQLSPYPDAIDFKALGVEVVEYTAMSDICKYFN